MKHAVFPKKFTLIECVVRFLGKFIKKFFDIFLVALIINKTSWNYEIYLVISWLN